MSEKYIWNLTDYLISLSWLTSVPKSSFKTWEWKSGSSTYSVKRATHLTVSQRLARWAQSHVLAVSISATICTMTCTSRCPFSMTGPFYRVIQRAFHLCHGYEMLDYSCILHYTWKAEPIFRKYHWGGKTPRGRPGQLLGRQINFQVMQGTSN